MGVYSIRCCSIIIQTTMLKCLFILGISVCFLSRLKAQVAVEAAWNGFERVDFKIDQHAAYYVEPVHPLQGNPWVWRSSFPDCHTDIDSILLTKGFYVAYINTDNQYGSPQAMQVWDKFYAYLLKNALLSPIPALEAVGRGALYAYAWAKRNPDKVSCVYAETPVCDFKSWPGGKDTGKGDSTSWKQLKQAYQFTEQQAVDYKDNPVDNLEGMVSFGIPILHVISTLDKLAPPQENSYPLTAKYLALGGRAVTEVIDKQPQQLFGHHFSIEHSERIAGFILKNSYPAKPMLPYQSYYSERAGIHNFLDVVSKKQSVTVAFLGGSITFNPGWRNKVVEYLKERFPQTRFRFVQAGIPSLGSLAHAFRVKRDLLDSGKVDLLFLEAAVNDRVNGTDSITQVRGLEGIVRHVKSANPLTDIILMSFADQDKNADYNKGKVPAEVANHELVAKRYKLPSINLAKEVSDKINNNEFSWERDFKDLHPSIFGQELYFESIKSLLQKCIDQSVLKLMIKPLHKSLNAANFENGNYYSITNAKHDKGWTVNTNWTPADQLGTRPGFVNVPVLSADKPCSELTLPFAGTAVGMAIVSGGDAGIVSYCIDNKRYKEIDLFTTWSNMLHLPWYVLFDGNLSRGKHVLKLKIAGHHNVNSKGNACRIVYFLRNEQ
jgi:sialidase-1